MDYLKERKKRKLTQSDVAIHAGISLFTYQLIEKGVTKNPRKEASEKIKELLSREVQAL